jgi:methylated-DNA-[protein]-cysteine S-methyltransferase
MTFGELSQTPLGVISFMAGDQGLQRLVFAPLYKLKEDLKNKDNNPSLSGLEVVGTLLEELNEYFFGIRKTFSVMVDWNGIEGFQRQVLVYTASIPFGEVSTYGEIAKQLGKPGAARAVGQALHDNPMPIVIPCHRVLGANGELRGYAGGVEAKTFLLNLEGHKILDGRLR